MKIPSATYRIQFRNGMSFDRAASLVPYLKRLGVSHIYASPIFSATSGSTHGYDVTDPNEIDPAIGGREGFERMVKVLRSANLGLILDIVPNHMAASLETPWWFDVIENGVGSRYARHFDIDWSQRLTLPFLGDTFETVLGNGDISVQLDPKTGKPALVYLESFYPLSPQTYQGREAEMLNVIAKTDLAELHERQPYRLMSWRDAPRDLSYRRFFEITGLAGVRVEDKTVFEDTHRLILELVHCGAVDGLRVDHVDGLADPKAYLEQLRLAAGEDCYITVEKILGDREQIPVDWPVSGTTGYEFVSALSDALVDGDKIDCLRNAYDNVVGRKVDMDAELRSAKVLMVDKNFEGEFTRLAKLAASIVETEGMSVDRASVISALRELLIAFPRYRTYGTKSDLPRDSHALLAEVVAKVSSELDAQALDLIVRILSGDVSEMALEEAAHFRTRFQQLTGPLMAKSVEDTLYFRQHMALALNEVGAQPLQRTFSLDRFHGAMKIRLARQRDAISSTSTHDTKRSEDSRARLYTLTEAPDVWAEHVARWRNINQAKIVGLPDGPAPEPTVEWMLYQALLGVWPPMLHIKDMASLKALRDRFLVYVKKSIREAKLRTNWGDNNEIYEKAVLEYAAYLLSPNNQEFLMDFEKAIQPFIRAGLLNSLSQTIIKLTAPGVPDIYQGSEMLDLSLVDPDNRREPDFAQLEMSLDTDDSAWLLSEENLWTGLTKQKVISRVLELRHEKRGLFRWGSYTPLLLGWPSVISYARELQGEVVIVVVARHPLVATPPVNLLQTGESAYVTPTLLEKLSGRKYTDFLSGEIFDSSRLVDTISRTQPHLVLTSSNRT